MLDIGWSEMAIILLVALVVIGPKDLPVVARNVGRWVGKARAMAREFQSSLEAMAREAELDKVRDEINKAGATDLKRTLEKQVDPEGELRSSLDMKAPAKPANGSEGDKSASASAAEPADAAPARAEAKADAPPPNGQGDGKTAQGAASRAPAD